MSASELEWGCCSLIDINEEYIHCIKCKKSFHCKCMNLDSTTCEPTAWICPICVSQTPKTKNNDNTPVRFNPNITVRGNKRQALQSPPGTSTTMAEDSVRAIIQEVIGNQFDTLIGKFTAAMKDILNSELKSMREEIKDIRDSVSFMSLQYEDILKDRKEDQAIIKKLQEQNDVLSATLKDVSSRLNNLEQQARANNIELQCVPQKKNENLIEIVKEIGKVINSDVKEEEISHCTRVMKSNNSSKRPKSIIVQFSTSKRRDSFLAASINFNRSKSITEKLNTSYLGLDDVKSPIYITEHLSPSNKALHAATRIKAKEKGYKHVWVRSGRIYVRKTDFTDYILIRDIDSLNKIV
ncbi:unnamed protein product [Colias eurytheme]|nr:unnamed protein product [Colias eurytheme]